jgi:uncharacterized protein (DUF362 family)
MRKLAKTDPSVDLQRDEAQTEPTVNSLRRIAKRALETDYLINIPSSKRIVQTLFTCALKNLKAVIPNRENVRYIHGNNKPIAYHAKHCDRIKNR